MIHLFTGKRLPRTTSPTPLFDTGKYEQTYIDALRSGRINRFKNVHSFAYYAKLARLAAEHNNREAF